MGPPESPTRPRKNQSAGRRKRRARRPRARFCLLKGCEQGFHPQQPRQRYCSERCRKEARKWSRWKAQQRYRETATGQEKRNRQSRRYRERVKSRKAVEQGVNEAARVITQEHFFSSTSVTGLGATSDSHSNGEVHCSASVRMHADARWNESWSGSGAGSRRAFNPDILIASQNFPYIRPVDATRVSSARPALGAFARAPSGATAAIASVGSRHWAANAHRGSSRRRPGRPLCGDRRL